MAFVGGVSGLASPRREALRLRVDTPYAGERLRYSTGIVLLSWRRLSSSVAVASLMLV